MTTNINFDIYQTLHTISRDMHYLAHYIGTQQGEMQDLGRSLNFIRYNELVTVKDLASYYGIKSSSATVKVTKLVEQGYVEKERNPNDLRAFILTLTIKGEEKCEKINANTITLVADIFDDLTNNQKLVLLDELRLIEKRLDAKKEKWKG